MNWWSEHKFRMIQNNLRDIDGTMNVDLEIAMLKRFHANVVQLGCGGISAFSNTDLVFQKKSPFLEGDKFGELVQKCHDNQIKVIARFDVSKVHESFEETHPEWMQRTKDGSTVHYNDTVITCVNGAYQQEKSLEIIGEILKKYPVDGIFFNMFGYQTIDYSGNEIGICQCDNCKRRFRELFGDTLPYKEDPQDPSFRKYQQFKEITVNELLHKIRTTVKEYSPKIAVSTYCDSGIDIIRCESNTAVDRPLPMWIYSASDNVSSIEGTFANKVSSNCSINAADIPYRFMGISDTFNQIRLYENMANGGNLDWCIIGSFEDYPDRSNYKGVETVFRFHETYQDVFDSLHSSSKVLLIQPVAPYSFGFSEEYRGIFKMLKETHIPFDTIIDVDTEEYRNDPEMYRLIIIPGITKLKSRKLRKALLKTKAAIIATAGGCSEDSELLQKLYGIKELNKHECIRGAYYKTEPKDIFSSFSSQDWIYQDKHYWIADLCGESLTNQEVVLPYLSPARFGPPERCYGHTVTEIPGAVIGPRGINITWEIGALYYTQGYESFKHVFLDLTDHIQKLSSLMPFTTDAHGSIEFLYNQIDENTNLLQLINLSGFNGVTIGEPVIQRQITISLKKTPVQIEELSEDGIIEIEFSGSSFTVCECRLHKAYRIRY